VLLTNVFYIREIMALKVGQLLDKQLRGMPSDPCGSKTSISFTKNYENNLFEKALKVDK
jgi:hypothetical protein